ncbi:MAG: hypothetical protein II873_09575 [Oscillospiraceae bacterium]|nr:hypothetical protein [Oscillospiraceae bacterium]
MRKLLSGFMCILLVCNVLLGVTAFAAAPAKERGGFENWKNIKALVAGYGFIAGLRSDGTVVAELSEDYYYPEKVDVSSWKNIKKISGGGSILIGLKNNGTVVWTGEDLGEQSHDAVTAWKNIVDLSSTGVHTIGVRKDGRVEYTGDVFFDGDYLSSLRGVKTVQAVVCSAGTMTLAFAKDGTLINDGRSYQAVASSGWLTTGIREDGSVYFWGIDAQTLQPEMTLWRDIKQVCPGDTGAVGLKKDGSLVFTSTALSRCREALTWKNIDRLIWGECLIGIRKDGTVIATGFRESDFRGWTDIVDVVPFDGKLVGLKSNGTVVTAQSTAEAEDSDDDYSDYSWELEEIRNSITAFDHGWLTFASGGDMYIPEQFAGSAEPYSESSIGRTYHFIDYQTNLTLKVTEAFLNEYPDVESEYIGDDYSGVTKYYVNRNGKRTDFISAKFAELKELYKDADYKKCEKEFCVISGSAGNYSYYIRYQVRNNAAYSLTFLYPPSRADECRPVVKQIEVQFLT